ncbi:Uncharacterised protein [uncultured archaeon]|nr:Uncharacterised protein [uncultured archaeon]
MWGKTAKREEKKGMKSITTTLCSVFRMWKILRILILISILAGCIGKVNKPDAGLTAQEGNEDGLTLVQSALAQNESVNISESKNISKPNSVRLILRPKELNRTGKFPVTLQIMNPKLNETVITVFKPGSGQVWYNQTSITYISNGSWTQNFSIKPIGNTSYVQMFIQISDNSTVVKKAAWNLTWGVPIGKAK